MQLINGNSMKLFHCASVGSKKSPPAGR